MFVEKLRLVDGNGQDAPLKVVVEYIDKPSPRAYRSRPKSRSVYRQAFHWDLLGINIQRQERAVRADRAPVFGSGRFPLATERADHRSHPEKGISTPQCKQHL